jgi:hypothetical protein
MRSWSIIMACAIGAAASAAAAEPVVVRYALGTLHGFPSMSDAAGRVIADGELSQELKGDRLTVKARWVFADGLRAEEHDAFRVGQEVVQEQYAWIETREGQELRRFEVDLTTGKALAATRSSKGKVKREEAKLKVPHGRSFAGFGVALVASQFLLEAGAHAELTVVAFTPKPRAVTLEVRRDGEEHIPVAGRSIRCNRYTLHPRIPFPQKLFAGVRDARLWLTHSEPPALVRAEQNLATKDDPVVIIDVTPRGAAFAHPRQP